MKQFITALAPWFGGKRQMAPTIVKLLGKPAAKARSRRRFSSSITPWRTADSRRRHVAERNPALDRLVEGTDYGIGLLEVVPAGFRSVPTLHNGVIYKVWVIDSGVRPPDEGGIWLEDLVAEACKRLLGCSQGQVRAVAGEDYLEFREFWPDPLIRPVREKIKMTINPGGYTQTVVVECAAVPGADKESVMFASTYALCLRTMGAGRLEWDGASKMRFTAGGPPKPTEIPCRYTVHRPGGEAVEVLIELPGEKAANWEATKYILARECLKMFGQGHLEYMPDLGETHFRWAT